MPIRRRLAADIRPTGAGARDKHVLIQWRPTDDTPDDSGFPVNTWSDLCWVWMSREDVYGEEDDRPVQRFSVVDTRWEMPYRADMDPEMFDLPKLRRLRYLDRTYDIVQGSQVGRKRTIEMITRANTRVEPDE